MARATFRVSGKGFELKAGEGEWKFTVRPGGWIIAESPTGERRRIALSEAKGKLSASMGGRLLHGELQTRERGAGSGPSPESDLSAQFPGKVRKVLVSDGAKVQAGDPLLLIEAMKMEFAVQAPGPGLVKRVLVREGQQLSPGDRFVDFEGTPPDA
jgi:biotin carboxyl carrier protein